MHQKIEMMITQLLEMDAMPLVMWKLDTYVQEGQQLPLIPVGSEQLEQALMRQTQLVQSSVVMEEFMAQKHVMTVIQHQEMVVMLLESLKQVMLVQVVQLQLLILVHFVIMDFRQMRLMILVRSSEEMEESMQLSNVMMVIQFLVMDEMLLVQLKLVGFVI